MSPTGCVVTGWHCKDAERADAGISLGILRRSDKAKGFALVSKRWIAERLFGWLCRRRRFGEDFEHVTRSHAGLVFLAMICPMAHRIARLQNTTSSSRPPKESLSFMECKR